ncbi:CmpA/NrtA family ABC transporter substrate-binding protein [Candidatus Methylospira mobilis]|uniref:CmpA/NrtA family ABC transporter substrate-binding protein n=1 Tax=Candidatus Methylospira mobilis TaxID=1808979 RepID=UPI0028EF83A1|nr:CmpA/NrtA family ABC transporter substrate-binding protein [Candidatus Methylospira mobilis]WNV04949.1 CmpA/NrtA family ABC transporter substrate-binding protein [Candidatus Methylospira mobilis]
MNIDGLKLKLGFVPLNDCAPLVIALEKGFFRNHGLDVSLVKEASWANIRDKVSVGMLDGAQMLAGMPLAATLGMEAMGQAMITGFTMSLNGNAVTVSNALYARLQQLDAEALAVRPLSATTLHRLVVQDKADGRPPLRAAIVYPSSTHNYLLRYWLASSGIDPDRDMELVVVPPPHMTGQLRDGRIDMCCVGEPWNTRAVAEGIGHVLIASYEIWNNHPEKVFAVTRQWSHRHPEVHRTLIMALLEAARWLDVPENRREASEILSRRAYLNVDARLLRNGLEGAFRYSLGDEPAALPDFHVFHRYAANLPWLSHAEWIVTQMIRWGQLPSTLDVKEAAAEVFRPDIYREAASAMGIAAPPENIKPEGAHTQNWLLTTPSDTFTMGADCFFDRGPFDRERSNTCLAGLAQQKQ